MLIPASFKILYFVISDISFAISASSICEADAAIFVAWLFKLSILRSKRFKVAPRVARLPATVLSAASIDEIAANALAALPIPMLAVPEALTPNAAEVVFDNLIPIC